MLNEALKNVAVIGAAGKMGSGIALLVLNEMAHISASATGNAGNHGRLLLVDQDENTLWGLMVFLRTQLTRLAEKRIVALRKSYQDRADLVENSEMITAFVNEALGNVRLDTDIKKAAGANLIFEAIIEDAIIKGKILKKLNALCSKSTYFLTNTSSIPISVLSQKGDLGGRIIGCHFYNPPAVQRLVEVIAPPKTSKKLKTMLADLGKRLGKILVPSNDVAGFIGNGHFMGDALYGMELVDSLKGEYKPFEAVYIINKVSQEFMIRPMGIFQLMDYVGVDVCQRILKTMSFYNKDKTLHSSLIDDMIKAKVCGGQFPNSMQKDGFLKYESNRPVGIYCLKKRKYMAIGESDWAQKCDKALGALPETCLPWRAMLRDPDKDTKLKAYFAELFQIKTLGADLAKQYLLKSRETGKQLVKDGIANKIDDVNTVLLNGFYHLYGPKNDFY